MKFVSGSEGADGQPPPPAVTYVPTEQTVDDLYAAGHIEAGAHFTAYFDIPVTVTGYNSGESPKIE